jgi:hypothetical protein
MLILSIKDFGACPCPRCLISINQIYALGREDDRKRREDSRGKDDTECRKKVDDARKSLYYEGYAITGDHVDGLLKDESLVPTKVSASTFTLLLHLKTILTERILSGPLSIWF